MVWAAILSALIVIAAILNIGTDEDTFNRIVRKALERMLTRKLQPSLGRPSARHRPRCSIFWSRRCRWRRRACSPPLTIVVNLWLAARIVNISGRLRRPVPDLAAMQFPAYAPVADRRPRSLFLSCRE